MLKKDWIIKKWSKRMHHVKTKNTAHIHPYKNQRRYRWTNRKKFPLNRFTHYNKEKTKQQQQQLARSLFDGEKLHYHHKENGLNFYCHRQKEKEHKESHGRRQKPTRGWTHTRSLSLFITHTNTRVHIRGSSKTWNRMRILIKPPFPAYAISSTYHR